METIFSTDSTAGSTYIAFFDLDRTITRAISGKELVKAAYRKGFLSDKNLAYAIILSFAIRLKLRDPQKIIDEMVKWVEGIPEKTFDELCQEVFLKTLLPSVYSEVIGELRSHKDKKAKVVILSSSLTPVCRRIASNLNMDDIVCSDLEVKNGYLTGSPQGRLCFGKEKAVRLTEYCEKYNSPLSDAWYYGDSFSDLPALMVVGNPICVNPDNRLKKTARKRGWPILLWHQVP